MGGLLGFTGMKAEPMGRAGTLPCRALALSRETTPTGALRSPVAPNGCGRIERPKGNEILSGQTGQAQTADEIWRVSVGIGALDQRPIRGLAGFNAYWITVCHGRADACRSSG
jgi:hypothetical protein